MATRTIELLLIETVENLGIVGDVVKVKAGYARNYLLPHGIAEVPSEERLAELQERRKHVQAELAALRSAREELHGRMGEIIISMIRSCNDQGLLYGSVSQRDISDALQENGFDVGIRSIRLGQAIKRVGEYPVPIQFDKDLRAEITLIIEPDHPIGEEREEMEFDNEGRLIHKPRKQKKEDQPAEKPAEAEPDEAPKEEQTDPSD